MRRSKKRIVFQYYLPGKEEGDKPQVSTIINEDKQVPIVDILELDKYKLMLCYVNGNKCEVNITCDSDFMTRTTPEVGKAIWSAHH